VRKHLIIINFKPFTIMATNSEKTIGKAIGNARALCTEVDSFGDFTPANPAETTTNLRSLIADLETADQLEATALSTYSTATSQRRKLFFTHADSLEKRYSEINSAVLRQYKSGSDEYNNISRKISKLRGKQRPAKDPKKPDAVHNSQSQKSFDSLTQGLSDLIGILNSFSTPFSTVNPRVEIATLTALKDELNLANNNVNIAIGKHKDSLEDRNKKFALVKKLADDIKESVRGQYTPKSSQYKRVSRFSI
jgi:hypothetical protein